MVRGFRHLDMQIETDNILRFFTSSNGSINYTPTAADLVHRWHMIVATLDTRTQAGRCIGMASRRPGIMAAASRTRPASFRSGKAPYFAAGI
jgi:hypothetical protein